MEKAKKKKKGQAGFGKADLESTMILIEFLNSTG